MQVRKFGSKTRSDEFYWHRDREDRLVKPISGEGWLLQLDNELPIDIFSKCSHYIPSGVWHRLIRTKHATDLIVQVHLRCNDQSVGI